MIAGRGFVDHRLSRLLNLGLVGPGLPGLGLRVRNIRLLNSGTQQNPYRGESRGSDIGEDCVSVVPIIARWVHIEAIEQKKYGQYKINAREN